MSNNMVRNIPVKLIQKKLAELIKKAEYRLPEDTLTALDRAAEQERSLTGKNIFKEIRENAAIAARENLPLCQDTGLALILLEIGQDVHISGGNLAQALQRTVGRSYTKNYLRKSVVNDPLARKNTGDNTPAIIYTHIVPGSKIKMTFLPKGGGSENCSALKMLKPAQGLAGVEEFVLETVRAAGGNPCPPIIVGIGLGGNFDHAAYLAKKALLRPLGRKNTLPIYRKLEQGLLQKINTLNIGPMGLGGKVTALAVHIEPYPCHIASLPVAVNIQCHSNRMATVMI
jgi:fumarate hydratase subunit alpha